MSGAIPPVPNTPSLLGAQLKKAQVQLTCSVLGAETSISFVVFMDRSQWPGGVRRGMSRPEVMMGLWTSVCAFIRRQLPCSSP
jgi:hypothetical protein